MTSYFIGQPEPDLFQRGDAQKPAAGLSVHQLLEALPEPVYMTDADGRLTFFNEASVSIWGRRPNTDLDKFCGSLKLYWPDGREMAVEDCPMAVALRDRRSNRGLEAIAERPDGTRISFLSFPTPLFDADGVLTGAVNMLLDTTQRAIVDEAAQQLIAIVQSSEDAILAKNLEGMIITWNPGAEKLFGYSPDEVIGKHVTMLIPLDRHDEEPDILGRIKRGERIDHYETIRRRKDGTLVEISLSVSPIRNRDGKIVGASKIARDITERRRAEEQQQLLLREMDHRVKNLFALASGVVSLSARSAATTAELASVVRERLAALATAHALTVPSTPDRSGSERATTLHTLIEVILAPYKNREANSNPRVVVTGSDVPIAGAAVTSFALLLHEFATNAAKYGALSEDRGVVNVHSHLAGNDLVLTWTERGGPFVVRTTDGDGFGTVLGKATVHNQLGGMIVREWNREGLAIKLSVPKDRLGNP